MEQLLIEQLAPSPPSASIPWGNKGLEKSREMPECGEKGRGRGEPKCFHTAELCSKCLGLGGVEAFQSFKCTFMIQTRRRRVVWRAHKISGGCVCSDIMDSKHCRRRWYGYWRTEHHQNKQLFLSASWETSQIFRRINCSAKLNGRTWYLEKKKSLLSSFKVIALSKIKNSLITFIRCYEKYVSQCFCPFNGNLWLLTETVLVNNIICNQVLFLCSTKEMITDILFLSELSF